MWVVATALTWSLFELLRTAGYGLRNLL
jgi:hypothetical protein